MPPCSTGRTSWNPRRASNVAATAARTPELQTVATGRSGSSAARSASDEVAVRHAHGAGNDLVLLVGLAHVEHLQLGIVEVAGVHHVEPFERRARGQPALDQRHAVESDGREEPDRVGALRLPTPRGS